ncbi:hypothetical protein CIN01S_09_02240 [Chryseobacterium indologenes NBRC 14944]|nr:hypothetical protein CIN01S_09_02240 [Chryseobacterium indologenes NBRC 14944]
MNCFVAVAVVVIIVWFLFVVDTKVRPDDDNSLSAGFSPMKNILFFAKISVPTFPLKEK